MTATVRHCARHNLDYRGRCPKCHPRRSRASSRPASRRQHVPIYERLVRIEPRPVLDQLVTTATFVSRQLKRKGISFDQLSAAEYAALFRRCSDLADRFNRRFDPPLHQQSAVGRGPAETL